jgi:hypothetical protein
VDQVVFVIDRFEVPVADCLAFGGDAAAIECADGFAVEPAVQYFVLAVEMTVAELWVEQCYVDWDLGSRRSDRHV